MLRLFFSLGISLLCGLSWGRAGEPSQLYVILPDETLATTVAERLPGIRIGILQERADEADEEFCARALALRNATHLIFDPCHDTPRLAMFRERLQMQGVVAINLRSPLGTGYRISRTASPNHREQLADHLVFLIANNR